MKIPTYFHGQNLHLHIHSSIFICLVCSYEIMESCWEQDPEDRPTFSDIHQTLCTLIEAENSDNYISMVGMDLCPMEHVQMENECRDQLQMAEDVATVVDSRVYRVSLTYEDGCRGAATDATNA